MALYTGVRVKKLVARLKEEYDGALAAQRRAADGLKEENRQLKARVMQLERERREVADALILAAKERERAARESAAEDENEKREMRLLASRCREACAQILEKYPAAEDAAALSAYAERLCPSGEESGFDMEEVIAPKQPLDLGKLCRSLGLMEEDA